MNVELEWDAEVIVTAVLNLSMGGAFLELPTGHAVTQGERVHVHLSVGERTTRQAAQVVRISDGPPRGFAAAWSAPTAETLAVVAILLEQARQAA